MKIKLDESFVKPYTGLFWYINGEVVGLVEDISNEPDNETLNKHHWQVWDKIKTKYKVNNHVVNYDYYPRGRIYVSKVLGLNYPTYLTVVDMDKCLDNNHIKDQIINYFNLYKNNFIDTVFTYDKNHYNCNKCRG